jgi:riboflavin kinase/FMN adenylyltransferase
MGDYRLLEKNAATYNYQLREIPKHIIDNIAISSTNIREAILHGDTSTATKLLGYDFFFSGEVVHGDKIGRTLGYPTANLKMADEEKIIPGNGIYAVYAQPEGYTDKLKGMMSIGFRPTVGGKKRMVEVNIFDFDKEIYGQQLKVFVKQYLREEVKYDGLEALIKQIGKDKEESLKVL